MKKSFWATRPFGYGDEYPMLSVGQVIEIEPGKQRNDEKLIRLGLLKDVADVQPVQCGKCGAWFLNDAYLNRHGQIHHAASAVVVGRREAPDADITTAEAIGKLRAMEAEDQFAERTIPLNLDQTKASKEPGRRRASR